MKWTRENERNEESMDDLGKVKEIHRVGEKKK